MVFQKFIQLGGVVFLPATGTIGTIVNIIDNNRLLLDDGNCKRSVANIKDIKVTSFKLKLCQGARPGTVKKAWAAADMSGKWAASSTAKNLVIKARRANLTDFERFKLMRLKQARNRIIKAELGKMKK
jgi:large subunit ribosomal protein L14e